MNNKSDLNQNGLPLQIYHKKFEVLHFESDHLK